MGTAIAGVAGPGSDVSGVVDGGVGAVEGVLIPAARRIRCCSKVCVGSMLSAASVAAGSAPIASPVATRRAGKGPAGKGPAGKGPAATDPPAGGPAGTTPARRRTWRMASTGELMDGSTAALHAGGSQRATAGNCVSLARRARLMVAGVSGNPARASRAPACANSLGVACCTAGVVARAVDGFWVLPSGDIVAAFVAATVAGGIAVLIRARGRRGP